MEVVYLKCRNLDLVEKFKSSRRFSSFLQYLSICVFYCSFFFFFLRNSLLRILFFALLWIIVLLPYLFWRLNASFPTVQTLSIVLLFSVVTLSSDVPQ